MKKVPLARYRKIVKREDAPGSVSHGYSPLWHHNEASLLGTIKSIPGGYSSRRLFLKHGL